MFVLVLIGVAVVEAFAFIEVGRAIGWLLAVVLLLGTSAFGARMLFIQGRLAIQRVSLALSERRAPGNTAIDGALGFLGGVLLLIPGFVTDFLGVLLLFPLIQKLTRRWMSRHYAGRMMRFVATAGRFVPGDRGGHSADVESTPADIESTWSRRTLISSAAETIRRAVVDGAHVTLGVQGMRGGYADSI